MDPFRDLYERYRADVFRFALFLTGDYSRAEDLTADTFVRAWTARDRIRQDTVRAYLLTITRNLYRDELRSRSSHQFTTLDDAVPDPRVEAQMFGRMAERFRSLLDERVRETADTESVSARERRTFERSRTLMKRRNQGFAGGVAYGLAALIALVLANPLNPPMPQPLVAATLVFVGIQLIAWAVWYSAVRELGAMKRT